MKIIDIYIFTYGLVWFFKTEKKKCSRQWNLPASSPSLKKCHENDLKKEMTLATQKRKKATKCTVTE